MSEDIEEVQEEEVKTYHPAIGTLMYSVYGGFNFGHYFPRGITSRFKRHDCWLEIAKKRTFKPFRL